MNKAIKIVGEIAVAIFVVLLIATSLGFFEEKYYDTKIITVKIDELLKVGEDVMVSVVDVNDPNGIKIGIIKPTDMKVWR